MFDKKSFMLWLAGFIDGEGTISISLRNPQPQNRTYYHTMRAFLSISNTNAEAMVYINTSLEKVYGEKIGQMGCYKQNQAHQKDFYLLSIAKFKHLEQLLVDLAPFLIIKRTQADIVLSFVRSRMAKGKKKHIGSDIDDNEKELRLRVISLNSRGK